MLVIRRHIIRPKLDRISRRIILVYIHIQFYLSTINTQTQTEHLQEFHVFTVGTFFARSLRFKLNTRPLRTALCCVTYPPYPEWPLKQIEMPDESLERAHHDSPWSCPEVIASTLPFPPSRAIISSQTARPQHTVIYDQSEKLWRRTWQVQAGVRVIEEALRGWVGLIVVVSGAGPELNE
jgi:hypothetical protein